MAKPNFNTQVMTAVSNLTHELKEAGVIPDDQFLNFQVGSPTYGNSHWVAVTGGDLGTAVSIIDSLHFPCDTKRADFLQAIKASARMLYLARYAAKHGTTYPHYI